MEHASTVALVARARAQFEQFIDENPTTGTTGSSTDAEQPFTTVDQLKDYWQPNRIREALGDDSYPLSDCSWIQNHYIRVFSILVLIEYYEFIEGIVRCDNLTDQHLPFRPNYSPPHNWPPGVDFALFYRAQWRFCVQDFNRQLLMKGAQFEEEKILPYRIHQCLNNGGSARTYLIKVARECNHLRDEEYPSGTVADADDYVLKTYYTEDASTYHSNEVRAFKHLMRGRGRQYLNNMVIFYGSWRHGKSYNILLEYANQGNLEAYWKRTHPPTSGEDILQFWSGLFGTLEALQRIHGLCPPGGGPLILQGIHQDIKPANILVTSVHDRSDYDVVFKIADLGLSHFKSKVKPEEIVGAKDTFGTPMYSAPECCRLGPLQHSDIIVKPSIDIWSLGCVFSEAATWVVLGEYGREYYAGLRTEEINQNYSELKAAGYGDCFHNGTDVLSAVEKMHTQLQDQRRVSDDIIENVIFLIQNMMETRPDCRYTTEQLLKNAQRITAKVMDRKFPKAFQKITGPVVEKPTPSQALVQSSAPSVRIAHQHQPRRSSSKTSTAMSMDLPHITSRQTPPQTPIQYPGQSAKYLGHHRNSSQASVKNINNLRRDSAAGPHGLQILDSSLDNDRSLMSSAPKRDSLSSSSQTTQRPFTSGSRRPAPLRANFVPKSADATDQLIQENSEGEDDTYEMTAVPRQPEYIQSPDGGISIREPPSSIHPGRIAKPLREYPFISVEDALNWRRGSTQPEGLSDHIESNLEKLQGRDHVFLIDDSASMSPAWKSVVRLFRALAGIVKHADTDGLDIVFAKSLECRHGKKRKELTRIITNKQPSGDCNMKEALQHVFELFGDLFEAPQEKRRSVFGRSIRSSTTSGRSQTKRGLSVYVFTDGVWQEGQSDVCGVEQPIRHMVTKLRKRQQLDCKVGVQFIRFGNDPAGERRLDILDSRLQNVAPDINMDIVDTTNSDGNVLKMLLGAIDRSWDAEDQMPVCSNSYRSATQQNTSALSNGHQVDFQI